MYCENCGRKLREGEVCTCMKRKKRGFNGLAIFSFLFLALGIVLVWYLWIRKETVIDKLPFDIPYSIKEYVNSALPAVLFIIGLIVGAFAIRKRNFKIISRIGTIGNLLGFLLMLGLTVLIGYRDFELRRLIGGELTSEVCDRIVTAYRDADEEAPIRNEIVERLSQEVASIEDQYNKEELSFEEATAKLDDIDSLNILEEGVSETREAVASLKDSKALFSQASELEAEDETMLQASKLYAEVSESDNNYNTAQEKISEIDKRVTSIIEKGISADNIDLMQSMYRDGDEKVRKQIEQKALDQGEKVKSDFLDSNIDHKEAEAQLTSLQIFSAVKDNIEEIRTDIDDLNTSREAFNEAVELEKDEETLLDAVASYQEVIEEDPNYDTAQAKISELNDKVSGIVQNGISADNLDSMISLYQRADESVVTLIDQKAKERTEEIKSDFQNNELTYEDAKNQLEMMESFTNVVDDVHSAENEVDKVQQAQETFAQAEELEKDQETLLEAIKLYRSIAEDDVNYEAAQKKVSGLLKSVADNCKTNASDLAAEHEYSKAIDVLDDGLEIVPDNEELSRIKEKYKAEYAKYALQEAEKLIEEKKYDEAKLLLGAAFTTTGDESLKTKLSMVDSYKPIALTEMHEASGHDYAVVETVTDSYGNSHQVALELTTSYAGEITYQLDGEYSLFRANLVTSDETGSDAVMNFAIFADDELVYSASKITRQQAAKEIQLDMTGVQKLDIKTNNEGGSNRLLYLTEASLERDPNAAGAAHQYERLADNVIIDSNEVQVDGSLQQDSYGDYYNGRVDIHANADGYILYNIDSKYKNITGKLVSSKDTDSNSSMTIRIYLDDVLAYEKTGIRKIDPPVEFSLNIENVNVLKIVGESDDGGSYCDIVDEKLFFERTPEIEAAEAATLTDTSVAADGAVDEAANGAVNEAVNEAVDETGIHRYEYYLLDGTWEDALAACASQGGYLVRINSQEEYDYILSQINNEEFRKYQFYIGGRRELGTQEYYWADSSNVLSGSALNGSGAWCAGNWMLGEPSFRDATLDVEEHVMDMFYYSNEGRWVWNDVPNNLPDVAPDYKGKIGYICEFEN